MKNCRNVGEAMGGVEKKEGFRQLHKRESSTYSVRVTLWGWRCTAIETRRLHYKFLKIFLDLKIMNPK